MVCRQCGQDNNINDEHCTFCGADLDKLYNEASACKGQKYESQLGFARPDTQYEAPLVINLISERGIRNLSKVRNEISDSKTNNVTSDNHEVRHSLVAKASTKSTNKWSKHKEKKLAEHRQQRLQEKLRTRLQEEKQGSLNRYMYQGLNQNLAEETKEDLISRYKDKSFIFSILGIITSVLLAVFLLLYLGSVSERTNYSFMARDAIMVSSSQWEAETYVFNSLGDMLFKFNGFLEIHYTPDHTAAIVYNRNTRYFAYVSAYNMKEFTTTVYSFALSEDGNYILYSISGGGSKYYLMLYDVRQDKETMVDLQEKYFDMLNVMPGGNVLSYCTYSASNEGAIKELQSYVIQNNVKQELGSNDMLIFAVAMDQSSIYYGDSSEGRVKSLYVRNNGIDQQISEDINGTIFFNKDFTEALVEDNGCYYFCSKDGVRIKVMDRLIKRLILPKKTINQMVADGVVRYGIQSFIGNILLGDDNSIHYLDDDLHTRLVDVISDAETVTMSKDGTELLYLDSQRQLIKINNLKDNSNPEVLAYGVTQYRAIENMSRVYYILDDDLYYKENNQVGKLICENIRSLCSNSEDIVFFLKDYESGNGTLFYSKEGLPAKKIVGGTNVTGVKEWNFGVIYQKIVNNTPAVFYNTKKTEFQFIMDGYDLLEASKIVFK